MKTANILEFKLLGTLQPWSKAKEILGRGMVSILETTQWYSGAVAGSKGEDGRAGIVSILETTQWYPGAMEGSKRENGKAAKKQGSLTQLSLTGIRLNMSTW